MSMRKLIESIDQLSGIQEATGSYNDSSDFESAASTVEVSLLNAKRTIFSPEWNEWMTETDANYAAQAVALNKQLQAKLIAAQKAYDELYNHLVDLS